MRKTDHSGVCNNPLTTFKNYTVSPADRSGLSEARIKCDNCGEDDMKSTASYCQNCGMMFDRS